ncbi:Crt-like 3 [Symbiodinium microadriaticum]|uniref:Crt-like 3 n=1 Tax=Symbiodinium microadriaticum TaxID=2951 RepID=A0A1Q9CZY8_SYMMI|nr:Crt-like 3 [Symbiodinium microadriaticum]
MECSDSDMEDEKLRYRRKLLVPIVFITYVITKALDRIFIYRVQKSMAHYSTILMSIYWPPGICLACFCFLFLLNGAKSLLGMTGRDEKRAFQPLGLGWFSPVSDFASAQGRVPQQWFALIGFLDQINATFSAPPSVYIPVVLQTPLNNLVVGWVMLISLVYLKMSFRAVHYAGVVLILCSCIVGELVELQGPPDLVCDGLDTAREIFEDESLPIPQKARWTVGNATEKCVRGLPPYKGADGRTIYVPFGTVASMYLLFIGTVIPYAFVYVYKHKKLKQVNLDVAWAFFWQSAWQVLWGLLFIPACWIPWPTPSGRNEASFSTFGKDLADSWTCFMGQNPNPKITSCSAEPAWAWFSIYLLFNVFFNLCLMWLIKRMSSTWAAVGAILCGNLGGFFSQFEVFGGKSAQPLSMEQWMALILSSIAMWVYNIEAFVNSWEKEEVDATGRSVYGEMTLGDHRYDTRGDMGLDPDSDGFQSDGEPTAEDHTTL